MLKMTTPDKPSGRIVWHMNRHCVYAHFEPGNDVPFYIGVGTDASGRPFRGGRWRKQVAWAEKVAKLDGVYEVKILSWHDTPDEARRAETAAIEAFQPITNTVGMASR
jgi:hypothetical protein